MCLLAYNGFVCMLILLVTSKTGMLLLPHLVAGDTSKTSTKRKS